MTLYDYFEILDKEDGRKRARVSNRSIFNTIDRLHSEGMFKQLDQISRIDYIVENIKNTSDKKIGYADTTMELFCYWVSESLPYFIPNADNLSVIRTKWLDKSFEYKRKYRARVNTNQYTKKELADKPEKGMETIFEGWKKLKPRLDEIFAKTKPSLQDFIEASEAMLFLMLTKYQQFRSAFLFIQFGKKQLGENRYDPATRIFHLYGKGTKGNPGDYHKNNEELHMYLKKWKVISGRVQGGANPNLFVNSNMKEHTLQSATTWLRRVTKKHLGHAVGIRAIRHAHITEGFEKDPLAPDDEVEERAIWQMHSLHEHRAYRRINEAQIFYDRSEKFSMFKDYISENNNLLVKS